MSKSISMAKTKYEPGELIQISFEGATIGTYPDWIAIYEDGVDFLGGSTPSIQYAYVNGSGSVVFNDINNTVTDRSSVYNNLDTDYNDLTKVYFNTREVPLPYLPVGKYYVIMLADGGYTQASDNIIEFEVKVATLNDKLTAIADSIRYKIKSVDKLTLSDMAEQAGREWVTGLFKNLPIENSAVKAVCQTLEGVVNTALNLGGGGDLSANIEKYTYLYLSRKYDWTIEPADALVGGDPVSDFVDYYWVQGDFTVTCNGVKSPRVYLDRAATRVDEYGEFRPPIIATIYGCQNYANWVGICDADTTEYNHEAVHDHWGYVQLGGDNIGGVYAELDTTLIPHDESTVVISRSNLCRQESSVLTAGRYKLVLFRYDIYGENSYEVLAESAPFTLT